MPQVPCVDDIDHRQQVQLSPALDEVAGSDACGANRGVDPRLIGPNAQDGLGVDPRAEGVLGENAQRPAGVLAASDRGGQPRGGLQGIFCGPICGQVDRRDAAHRQRSLLTSRQPDEQEELSHAAPCSWP